MEYEPLMFLTVMPSQLHHLNYENCVPNLFLCCGLDCGGTRLMSNSYKKKKLLLNLIIIRQSLTYKFKGLR